MAETPIRSPRSIMNIFMEDLKNVLIETETHERNYINLSEEHDALKRENAKLKKRINKLEAAMKDDDTS
jgi:cell division protein FtsB